MGSSQVVQTFFLTGAMAVEAMRKAIRYGLVVEFIFHILFVCPAVRERDAAAKVRNKVVFI